MIIRTDRLVLREFEETDWPAVLAYQPDPLYLRYYHWTHRTEQDVRAFVRMFIAWRAEEPRTKFQFAIVLPPDGSLIGNCGIRMKSAEAHEADIGYELDNHYWRHGYATEAARALLSFGFGNLGLHRIWSWCIADNIGSARVSGEDRPAAGRTSAGEGMDEGPVVGHVAVCHSEARMADAPMSPFRT